MCYKSPYLVCLVWLGVPASPASCQCSHEITSFLHTLVIVITLPVCGEDALHGESGVVKP